MNRLSNYWRLAAFFGFVSCLWELPSVGEEPAPASTAVGVPNVEDPLELAGSLFGDTPVASHSSADRDENAPAISAPAAPIRAIAKPTEQNNGQPTQNAAGARPAKLYTNFATAVHDAQLQNRPMLVVLGARWCAWCRKLDAELETAAAEPIRAEWIIAKVDVDDEPELGRRFEASGLPALRILGPWQTVVASQEGYLEIDALKQWLAENRSAADPAKNAVLFDTAPPDPAAVRKLVEMLGEPSPMPRAAAIERLAAHPENGAAAVVEILKTGRLIQQLSACDVLRRWQAPIGEIDPWRPDTIDTEQLEALIEWSRNRASAPQPHEPGDNAQTSALPTDDSSIGDLLQRLLSSPPEQRPGLIAQLVAAGPAVAVELRTRLAQGEALDDANRESMRELLYNTLASQNLRLANAGIISAMARLDAESHRQASDALLGAAEVLDAPLVDELARDTDPLVRELAVRALGRVGLLNGESRIGPLLRDSNSNVRTAVLRVLTEHPSDESVKSLCEYLREETDEDLLVHGAKCLGQLPRQLQALQALAELAANPSWRVRASALDAAGVALDALTQTPPDAAALANRPTRLPDALVNAMIAAVSEPDAFVAERAAKLLPKLVRTNLADSATLETIATLLADHPEKLQVVMIAAAGGLRFYTGPEQAAQQMAPLVNLARQWLASNDAKKISRATAILSRLAPGELNDRLSSLIASTDRATRLAGVRAAIQAIEEFRKSSFEAAIGAAAGDAPAAGPHRGQSVTRTFAPNGSHGFVVVQSDVYLGDVPPVRQPIAVGTPSLYPAPNGQGYSVLQPNPAPAAPPGQVTENRARALQVASELFGQLPADVEAPANRQPSPSPASKAEDPLELSTIPPSPFPPLRDNGSQAVSTPQPEQVSAAMLPSQWMQRWHNGNFQGRPGWLAACDAPTQKLLVSDDDTERKWALVLWLMLGHTDHVDDLVATVGDPQHLTLTADEPQPLKWQSWLPSEQRFEGCEAALSAVANQPDKIQPTLREITLIDDQRLAAGLFAQFDEPTLADAKLRDGLPRILLRSLLGGFIEDRLPTSLSAENYQYTAEPPYRVARTMQPLAIPGATEACQWLRQRIESDASHRQRVVALAALAQLDHQAAVDAALAIVEKAEAGGELLQASLAVVLCDAAVPSAGRATMLLTHSSPAVRTAALRCLASPSSMLRDEQKTNIIVVQDVSPLPGLWRTDGKLDTDKLRTFAAEGDAAQKTQAALLLAAAGEETDIDQLQHGVNDLYHEQANLCLAAALAKAGRTDEAAIVHYRQALKEANTRAQSGDAQQAAALYEVLRDLPGDEAAAIRHQMRTERGAELFNKPEANADLFGH